MTPRAKHLVIEGSVAIRNTSDTKVQVLASTFDITGMRIVPVRVKPEDFVKATSDANLEKFSQAERHMVSEPPGIVSHGRLVPESSYVEPAESGSVPILTWVPKGTYNALRVDAWVAVGRGKTLGIEDAKPVSFRDRGGVVYRTRLPEAGLLRRLTRGDLPPRDVQQ